MFCVCCLFCSVLLLLSELALFSILMLVPGSIGVRSVLASDAISTLGFLTQMLTVAIAIVTGLFTANVVVPPIRAL